MLSVVTVIVDADEPVTHRHISHAVERLNLGTLRSFQTMSEGDVTLDRLERSVRAVGDLAVRGFMNLLPLNIENGNQWP